MSKFRGVPATYEVPGAFRVSFVFIGEYTNDLINFRTAARFGSAPGMTAQQRLDAVERGELKKVTIKLTGGTALRVSDAEDDYVNGRFNGVDSTTPVMDKVYRNEWGCWYQRWTSAGNVAGEVEAWFDIPEEDEL